MSIEQSNIVIKLGETVEIKSPDRLRIRQQVNEHATIYFREQIKGNITQYRKLVEGQTTISVYPVNSLSHKLSPNAPKLLFQGIATKIEVRYDLNGADYIEVFGMSNTLLLDTTRKRRSFQNKKQTLREMVNEILAGYPKALCIIDPTIGSKLLDQFLLQWNETDWDYVKRVASVLFNTVLVANHLAEKPELSFGIPEGRERQLDSHCRLNYEISSVMEDSEFDLQLNRSRFDDKLDDNDRFYFTFEGTNEIYQIGERVNFHNRVLTVCKTTAELKGNVLKFGYIMATANGLKVPRTYNESLVGQAISGKVMEVNGNCVKINFGIDKGRNFEKEKASWFPYATPYTAGGESGWYFMPEIGDEVQLTFPNNREEQAYAIYAVRNKQTPSTDDPQIKYLRTKDGKEIRFGPKELVITGKDKEVYIQMTEDEGITINSNSNIALEAKGKILLAAKENVNLYAETGINMISNAGGSVQMDGTTRIFGRKINDKQWTKAELKTLKSAAALAGVVVPKAVQARRSTSTNTPVQTDSKLGFIQLPNSGVGYGRYLPDPNGDDNWGQPSFVNALIELAKRWYEMDCNNLIQFGDLSRKNGGKLPPHASHKTGIDADLKLFYNGVEIGNMNKAKTYNKTKCQDFTNLVTNEFPQFVERLFGDDTIIGLSPNIYKESNVSLRTVHRHHFHLGF